MCRFLIVKSRALISPQSLLKSFSRMAQNSRSYDGDWQGDGWGISWLENNQWSVYKSLSPIWTQRDKFSGFPHTTHFSVHARSASFPFHRAIIDYNQPFVNGPYSFVFNGLVKKIRLSLPGQIGSQKIWSLLQKLLVRMSPPQALAKLKQILFSQSGHIQALNIGLSDQKNIYSLNFFSKHKKYYQLHYFKNRNIKIICSEKLHTPGVCKLHTPGVCS